MRPAARSQFAISTQAPPARGAEIRGPSSRLSRLNATQRRPSSHPPPERNPAPLFRPAAQPSAPRRRRRSEEHTSELQSRFDLVCRLLLEKKKIIKKYKQQ